MSPKTRLWAIATALLSVIVILYGVFAGLVPLISEASRTHELTEISNELNDVQRIQLSALQDAQSNEFTLNQQLEELRMAIPDTVNWPEFLWQLQNIEITTGADVKAIVVNPIVPSVPAESGTEISPDELSGSESDPVDPEDSPAGNAESVPAEISSVVEVPVSITLSGDMTQITEFQRAFQTSDRLFFEEHFEVGISQTGHEGLIVGSLFFKI